MDTGCGLTVGLRLKFNKNKTHAVPIITQSYKDTLVESLLSDNQLTFFLEARIIGRFCLSNLKSTSGTCAQYICIWRKHAHIYECLAHAETSPRVLQHLAGSHGWWGHFSASMSSRVTMPVWFNLYTCVICLCHVDLLMHNAVVKKTTSKTQKLNKRLLKRNWNFFRQQQIRRQKVLFIASAKWAAAERRITACVVNNNLNCRL